MKICDTVMKAVKFQYSNDKYENCVNALSISPRKRGSFEINKMIPYLETLSSFAQLLRSEKDKKYNDFIFHIGKMMVYEKIKKNQFIVKYGEKGSKFFIILTGKVAILITKNVKCLLNEEEYIEHLLVLRKNNETEMLRNTITLNKNIYHIEENFDLWLNNILSKKEDPPYSNELFVKIEETLTYIKKNSNTNINNPITPEEYMEKINIPSIYLPDEKNRKLLIIPSYSFVNIFSKGQTFGYFALENKNQKRTATLISLEDCEFGIIEKEIYLLLLKNVHEKARRKFYEMIYSFSFFKSVSKGIFENYYFNFFKYQQMERGNKIIQQGETSNQVFFLQSGEYGIFTDKNICEINDMIIVLKKLIKQKYTKEVNENEEYKMCKHFKPLYWQKLVFQQKYAKIGIIKDRDVVGLFDIINSYNLIANFSVECLSSKSEMFSIQRNNFSNILSREQEVQSSLNEFTIQKIKFLIERLTIYKQNVFDEIQKIEAQKAKSNQKVIEILEKKDKNKFPDSQTSFTPLTTCQNHSHFSNSSLSLKNKNELPIIFRPAQKLSKKRQQKIKMLKLEELTNNSNQRYYHTNPSSPSVSSPIRLNSVKNENFLQNYKKQIMNQNLFNNVFHSYLHKEAKKDEELKRSCIKMSLYMKSTKREPKAKIIYVDCLIMDKFNTYYSQALSTFSNSKLYK